MLRGLYEFRPINDKTLGFGVNDLLLFLEPHTRDKNWLRVADPNGRIGFVPINFIEVYRETSSERLMCFLEEALRRARRDRLPTLELLTAVRQNILTSPYTTEQHVAQIDREVMELRSKAISELNYEGDGQQNRGYNKIHSSSGVGGMGEETSRSPRRNNFPLGALHALPPPLTGEHPHPPFIDTFLEMEAKGGNKMKKKKEQPQVPQRKAEEAIQYSSVQFGNRNVGGRKVMPETAEYVRMDPTMLLKGQEVIKERGDDGYAIPCIEKNCIKPPRRFSEEFDNPSINYTQLGAELVDIVRNSTGLSHKLSQDATQAVLGFMDEKFEAGDWGKLLGLFYHLLNTPRAVSQELSVISESFDAMQIRKIFKCITRCKEDEQQRSWALHEDELMILENLKNLYTILNDADPSISQYVMDSDKYRSVAELVLYYQMETRWCIRGKLLDCFKIMCSIDEKAHSVLLNSILPMELAREVKESLDNVERIKLCAEVMVVLLSSGENIPITHFDFLGMDFLQFLFDLIESPPNADEKITDTIMNLLFAYNLQFKPEYNLIIANLENRPNAGVFTQKVIYFLNRAVDPLANYSATAARRKNPNSVMKLTTDIFRSNRAASLFYTNDIKVLIDIVTRCVTDLDAGNEERTLYLGLIQVIVRNCHYEEHKHRLEDLLHSFTSILLEEDKGTERDQRIIRQIAGEFPTLFKF